MQIKGKEVQVTNYAMGGTFTYTAFPQKQYSESDLINIFKEAHNEVLRIQHKYTEFQKSYLTQMINKAKLKPCVTDEETYFLLKKAQSFYQKSQGIFDITFSSYSKKWREALKQNKSLTPAESEEFKSLVDFNQIILNDQNRTIFIPNKNQFISFGGMGKGYAVDRSFDIIEKKGVVNFSVNGSGDIKVHSSQDAPRLWKIGIQNPFTRDKRKNAGMVQVSTGSVSTSGSYIQNNPKSNSGRDHHIVSQYSDFSSPPPISATVLHPNSMDSDIWATVLLATDTIKAFDLMNRYQLKGILIDYQGKTILSTSAIKNLS